MKLVSADQMRALEKRADAGGNTYAMMMERAGKAVAEATMLRLVAHGTRQNRVLVLVGPGNNGGDGLVCARYLADTGAPVSLYVWKRALKESDENLNLCLTRELPLTRAEDDTGFAVLKRLLSENDVIVDALLGTGVSKPIEGTLKELLAVARERMGKMAEPGLNPLVPPLPEPPRRPFVVAVDLPSGLNPDTGALDPATLSADLTVTFAFPKIGQLTPPGALAVGELIVADIGIPSAWAEDVKLEVADARGIAAQLPARPRESHKGTFGKAMLCAGSGNYIGAAYLAGTAATHAGAGLVTLALARTILPVIASTSHETTYVPLPDDNGALVPDAVPVLVGALEGYDALLVGPGFGRHPQTIEFVRQLLQHGHLKATPVVPMPKPDAGPAKQANTSGGPVIVVTGSPTLPPLVIDADALYALSQTPDWWTRLQPNTAILTPHPGEMATLCGLKPSEVQEDRIGVVKRFASQWRQIIVLKGAYTAIGEASGRVTLIPFATPALATAGTGDVLAGTITALLAQQLAPFDAAVVGAYLHGLAGAIAAREFGDAGVVAGDLLPRLPRTIRSLR